MAWFIVACILTSLANVVKGGEETHLLRRGAEAALLPGWPAALRHPVGLLIRGEVVQVHDREHQPGPTHQVGPGV